MNYSDDSNEEFQVIEEENSFEYQLREIDEWQNNSTNPGYYIGSGKVPLPIRNLFKSSILMIIVGILFAIPTIIFLIEDFSIGSIINSLFMIIISVSFIVGGILRLRRKR